MSDRRSVAYIERHSTTRAAETGRLARTKATRGASPFERSQNFEPRSFRIGSAPILCDVLTETDVPRGVLSASSPSEVVSDDRCISG